jgi:hypothetical protein
MAMIRYTDINTGNNYVDEALENYLMHGLQPGGFVTAVLANNLRLATGRADHWNREILFKIVDEVTYKVPDLAWGNSIRVKEWLADKDGRRSAYSLQKEKEYTWRVLKGEVREKELQDPPF